jgi:tetratricopeptide (TPR) repeat protein
MNGDRAPAPNCAGEALRRRRVILAAAIGGGALLLAVLGVIVVWRENPQHKLERARVISASDPARALRLLESSLAGDSKYPPGAQLLKCQILAVLGRESEALAVFDEIHNPSNCDASELLAVADAAEKTGATRLAEKSLFAARRPGPQHETALRMLISLEYEMENYSLVLDCCQELAQLVPGDSFPWLVSAGIYHENEHVPEALDAYRQALQRNPPAREVSRLRYQIADLSLFTGDLSAARKEVDLLLANREASPAVPLLHARLLRNEGKPQEALIAINRILTPNHDLASALRLRGEIYLDEGQFERAAEDLLQVVHAHPFDYQAHYKLAQAYLRTGQTEKAQTHLETSRRLTDVESEIQALEYKIQREPSKRQIRLRLAELYEQRGDPEMAQHWRNSAQSLP